ncbi:hypothetical protein B0O80DRAFT_430809 [Mortierella sp. GBAus27b]|nr:hypothetical protein B0O80DRAFT_430809 [Mortierella sp. GBAus27b]
MATNSASQSAPHEALSWSTCKCAGEADVCIGSQLGFEVVAIMQDVCPDLDVDNMILEYCQRASLERDLPEVCDPSHFDLSKDIFDHHEDWIQTPLPTNATLDMEMKSLFREVRQFLRQCTEARKLRKASKAITSSSSSPPAAQASTSSSPISSAVSSNPSTSTSVVATVLNNAPIKTIRPRILEIYAPKPIQTQDVQGQRTSHYSHLFQEASY